MKTYPLLKPASKLALISLASATLFGCGGGNSGNVVLDQPIPVAQLPPSMAVYDVSGMITGLDGEVVITANDQTISQSTSGGFEFTDIVETGGSVSIAITSDPLGQSCAVTGDTEFENVRGNVSVVVDCIDIPLINARVQSFFSGDIIDEEKVRMARHEEDALLIETLAGSDEGFAAFEVPLSAGRLSLNTNPIGFGAQTVIIDTPAVGKSVVADMFVQNADVVTDFNNVSGANVSVGGDTIATIPTNSFVDANGVQVPGDINLELTLIDPSQSIEQRI